MKTKKKKQYEVTIRQMVAFIYTVEANSEEEAQYNAELEMENDSGEVISQEVEITEA